MYLQFCYPLAMVAICVWAEQERRFRRVAEFINTS